jgi:hypothetical protein
MCISSLGLYVLPAALSSFKELARRIKQSNEDFVLASKMPGILHRPGSNRAVVTRLKPVTVDLPRQVAQTVQLLPESRNEARFFVKIFLELAEERACGKLAGLDSHEVNLSGAYDICGRTAGIEEEG